MSDNPLDELAPLSDANGARPTSEPHIPPEPITSERDHPSPYAASYTPPVGYPPPQDPQVARLMAEPEEWAAAESPLPTPPTRLLIVGVVVLSTLCLCLTMVGLAGFAGYRDGLATNDARITQTLATGVAQQYATGVSDLQAGYAELAEARFAWIVETLRAPTQYALDSPIQLAVARTVAAYTDTPFPTPSPSQTPTFTPLPTQPATLTPDPSQNPAYFYEQAETALRLADYEDAIDWLDALMALDPTYRAEEVRALLIKALTQQGKIYLRGQNEDGEDKLARGVYLVYRASDLGEIEDTLLGEAIFVEKYVNARNYVNGGYYTAAIPILEELCSINCGWSYHGVSVRNLLEQAQAGASVSP